MATTRFPVDHLIHKRRLPLDFLPKMQSSNSLPSSEAANPSQGITHEPLLMELASTYSIAVTDS